VLSLSRVNQIMDRYMMKASEGDSYKSANGYVKMLAWEARNGWTDNECEKSN
jgi:hypothetical protein